MKKFQMGKPFKNIGELVDYDFPVVYFHENQVHVAVVNNWQLGFILRNLPFICKAELTEGMNIYQVTARVKGDNDLVITHKIVNETADKAIKDMMRYYLYGNAEDWDFEVFVVGGVVNADRRRNNQASERETW